ncbi:MAG: UbiA family prenyltransferase [Sphingobium sp.]
MLVEEDLRENGAKIRKPLVVDLDGTLIRSDLLIETMFGAAGRDIRLLVPMLRALRHGKAAVKHHLATASVLDAASLPYDPDVLRLIGAAREEGRPVYLASGASASLVSAVADHVGLFSGWFASDHRENLVGATKAARLVKEFGESGFDYVGNEAADLPIWRKADEAIGVRVPRAVAVRARRAGTQLREIGTQESQAKAWLRQLRVHQYAKNALVFVPMLTSGMFKAETLLLCMLAFVAFSMMASSIYIINDIVDLGADRRHPSKCRRPLASGILPIHRALLVSVALAIGAMGVAALASLSFLAILVAYAALTTSYSFILKRKFLVDVVALSMLYTIRVVGGAVATDIPLSEWLGAFSMMVFTCLALTKRYTELAVRMDSQLPEADNRNYRTSDMGMIMSMAVAAAYVSVTVFALYLASPDVHAAYRHPLFLWAICPTLFYWLGRMLMLAHRRFMHDDPVVFALRDRTSAVTLALVLIIMVSAR